jgi:hypothetical protein
MVKNFVVEPNVVNRVSKVSVSVENETPALVLILSFLQDEREIDNTIKQIPASVWKFENLKI